MRRAFASAICEAAKNDARIIVLSGDFGYKLFGELEADPAKWRNCGCAEQTMVGVAAGLAIAGRIPVVITITPFLVERAFEQLRLDVGEQNLKVICAGYDDYPNAGPTHQGVNARRLADLLPNFQYFEPFSNEETRNNVRLALTWTGPSFFRLRKAP